MGPKVHQEKTPSQSSTAPARVLKPPRPFADADARPETAEIPEPDLDGWLERAARFGHRLDRVAAPAGRPSSLGGSVVQRMKRRKPNDGGNKKKKQKTTPPNQRPITSFFRPNSNPPSSSNLPSPQPTTPSVSSTSSNLVSNTNSNLSSVSNLVSSTNTNLVQSPVVKPDKQEVGITSSPKKNNAEELARIKQLHPHLKNVPDEWILPGAHNPQGPPITLQPPAHPGPTEQTQTLLEDHPHHHVVDLSTGSFQIYRGKDQEPLTYKIDREGQDPEETMSDVRNYAMLTNAYLSTVGPQAAQNTKRKEKGSIGQHATQIATEERRSRTKSRKDDDVYGKKVVGHVPDSSISGVPYSPMGFLPMTSDANAIVGNASGIGLKVYNKAQIASILVMEKGGQFHHYNLPSGTSTTDDDNPPATTSTSNISSTLTFDVQDEFQWDEEAERQLQQIEETYNQEKKPNDPNEEL